MPSIACNCGGYRGDFDCSEVEWESQVCGNNNSPSEPPVEWRGTYETECPKCGRTISAVYVIMESPKGVIKAKRTDHFFCSVEGFCEPEELTA